MQLLDVPLGRGRIGPPTGLVGLDVQPLGVLVLVEAGLVVVEGGEQGGGPFEQLVDVRPAGP